MRKQRAKDGVGQLVLQIAFQASNAAGETQANGPRASSAPEEPRSRTERKGKWYPEKTHVVSVALGFGFLGFHNFCDPTHGHGDHLRTPARKGRIGGEPYAGNPHVRFGTEGGG